MGQGNTCNFPSKISTSLSINTTSTINKTTERKLKGEIQIRESTTFLNLPKNIEEIKLERCSLLDSLGYCEFCV